MSAQVEAILTGQLMIRDERTEVIVMTTDVNNNAIDAATAANSGSATTNTSIAQQTTIQQNNALFAKNLSEQQVLFKAQVSEQQQLFQTSLIHMMNTNSQTIASIVGQTTAAKNSDTVVSLAQTGAIVILS